jgi:MFS family permease
VIVSMSADLTRGKGGFNTLMGLFATALAVGGVVGPLITGELIQHLGFVKMFVAFAAMAALGAVWFQMLVPETRKTSDNAQSSRMLGKEAA